jgi:hypothetical protein
MAPGSPAPEISCRICHAAIGCLQPGADKLRLSIQADGLENFASLNISDEQAAILRRLDGVQSLGQIHASVMPEQAWERFLEVFTGIQAPLTNMGVLFLSQNKFG